MKVEQRRRKRWMKVALLAVGFFLGHGAAFAAPHVFSPIVEEGEAEIEFKGDRTFDAQPENNNAQSYNVSLGYGMTSYWFAELEGQWKRTSDGTRFFDSTSFENIFQLTPQGKYWLDAGLFAEFEKVAQQDDHNNATLGLLLQKELGSSNVTTANFLFSREFGGAPGISLETRLQTRWRITQWFQPGVELYREFGRVGNFHSFEGSRTRIGPVSVGAIPLGRVGKVKYELGYLFGTSRASEKGTVRGLIEFERHF